MWMIVVIVVIVVVRVVFSIEIVLIVGLMEIEIESSIGSRVESVGMDVGKDLKSPQSLYRTWN